jgi:parallel beta-helix repeat protein
MGERVKSSYALRKLFILSLILGLLSTLIMTPSTQADSPLPTFQVLPSSGPGGASVSLKGDDFYPNSLVNLSYYNPISAAWIPIGSLVSVDSSGQFTFNMTAPDLMQALPAGNQIEAYDEIVFRATENSTGNSYDATFREYRRGLLQLVSQLAPTGQLFGNLSVFTSTVSVSQSVRVAGKYFNPGNLNIFWDGVPVGFGTADETGFFNTTFVVPASAVGVHSVILQQPNNNFVFNLTVRPSLSLSTSRGLPGTVVTARGYGFPAEDSPSGAVYSVTLTWVGSTSSFVVAWALTDPTGSFNTTFSVPQDSPGAHSIRAVASDAKSTNVTYSFWIPWSVDDDGPADFSSIQTAIDTLPSGSIIYVRSGHYYEQLSINKSLTIYGEDRMTTIIYGSDQLIINGTVANVIIDTFTLVQNYSVGVFGNAYLYLRNSDLILIPDWFWGYSIFTEDTARIAFWNVSVSSSDAAFQLYQGLNGQPSSGYAASFTWTSWNVPTYTYCLGNIQVVNSTGVGDYTVERTASFISCTGTGRIQSVGTAPITITNSNMGYVSINVQNSNLNITGIRGGYISYFSASGTTITNSYLQMDFNLYSSTVGFNNCEGISISANYNSSVTVLDSTVTDISMSSWWWFDSSQTTLHMQNTTVTGYINCYDNSSLTALDSYISGAYVSDSRAIVSDSTILWLSLQGIADVVVHDSEIGSLDISVNDAVLNITGLRGGYTSYFSTSSNITVTTGSLPTLTVTNSNIQFSFNMFNSSVSFNNCELIGIYAYGNSSVTGRDSTITSISAGSYWSYEQDRSSLLLQNTNITDYLAAYGESIVTIHSSTLSWLSIENQAAISIYDSTANGVYCWSLNSTDVFFSNVTVGSFSSSESNFYLQGEFEFRNGYLQWWQNSNVTRTFSVTVNDVASNPVPSAELTLYDQAKGLIWSGYSDSNGKASFSVTFTDTNYASGFTLKAVKGDLVCSKSISFLSNSTMLLSIHPPTVHNLDTGLSYASIQEAIDATQTMDEHTIFVEDGVYYENLVVNKSVKIRGENNVSTVINAGNAGNVVTVTASNVEISGFTIENSGYSPYCGIYVGTVTGANFSYNIIENNYDGIKLSGSSNSTLFGNQIADNDGWAVNIENSSHIMLYNNNVTSNSYWFGGGLGIYDSSVDLVNCIVRDYYSIANGNSMITMLNSTISYMGIWDNASLSLQSTNVTDYISASGNSGVTALASTLSSIYSSDNVNLILQNTNVTSWMSCYGNSNVTVLDSTASNIDTSDNANLFLQSGNVDYITCYLNSSAVIHGSLISWLYIEQQAAVSVYASSIGELYTWNVNNTLLLSDVTVGSFSIYESCFYLQGDITVSGSGYLNWYNSNVTRNFSIIVKDLVGNVVPNAELKLYDQSKVIVWSGYSDSNGEANFSITFTDSNYASGLTLKAVKQDLADAKNIGFLSNSTIVICIHPPTVHNIDTGLSYTTIQEAIDASETLNGHTLFVESGLYFENIIINKSIKLQGESDASTVLNGGNAGNTISIVADNVEITGFTIENGGGGYGGYMPDCGVRVSNSTGVKINNNIFRDNYYYAVGIENSSLVIVSNNVVTSNQGGIVLFYSSNSAVSDNYLFQNGFGVGMLNCSSVTVSANDITGTSNYGYTSYGIILYFSLNITAYGNNVRQNEYGLLLYECQSSNIYENYVLGNTYSIALWNSSNNLFYHNIFFPNVNQTEILESNFNNWDNDEEGNFWSDYSGTDTNGDGIGDTPYIIDGNNTDRYPLVCPVGSFDAGEWNGTACNVSIASNSTISNFQINETKKTISFTVSGTSQTFGFSIITIPNIIVETMWQNNFTVMIDGQPCSFRSWADAENTYIFVNYTHSEHEVMMHSADSNPPTTSDDYDGMWHTSDFTITLTATDDTGVNATYYRLNGGTQKSIAVNGQPIITTEGAANTLEYWSIDNAGNEETHHVLTGIKLDKTVPTGSIQINGGASYATSTSVTLTLTATDSISGVSQMRFSNDGTTWSSWESTTTTKAWTLTSGDGPKIVYYQIKDNAGLISSPTYFALISVDTSPPQGSITINNGAAYTNMTTVNLKLTATDTVSGVSQMRFNNDYGAWSNWEPYSTSKSWNLTAGDGEKYVFVQYMDSAGLNVTAYQIITLDTTSPIANAGQNRTVNTGDTVNFNASNSTDSNGIVSYAWNFGDGATGTGITATHVYSNPGTYTATLTVQDAAGNSASNSVTITVQYVIPEFSPAAMLTALITIISAIMLMFGGKQKSNKRR